MANLYHLSELPQPGAAELTGDLAHHLVRVLRVRPGKEIRLGDGRGHTCLAIVTATDKRTLTVAVEPHQFTEPHRPALTLAFAVPRANRADWLLEHATEIGVNKLVPLLTARSRPQGLRTDRWRKIVAAAAGQCARPWLPEVAEPVELTQWLTEHCLPQTRLLADAAGHAPPALSPAQDAALLVGPEGGLTQAEREAALAAGFAAVRFAPHILRTETAALVGAAIVLAERPSS